MIDHKIRAQSEGGDGNSTRGEKLDSWKEIAAYLGREVRTVQRWEKQEGLPVHRHQHEKLGTVYAFKGELDLWLEQRQPPATGSVERVETAPVEPGAPASVECLETSPVEHGEPRESLAPADDGSALDRKRSALVIIFVILIPIAGMLLARRVTGRRVPVAAPAVTIAVLPFQNLSEQAGPDWFSQGLAEEMTVQLERLQPSRLRVIGETTAAMLESGRKPLEEAGRELGVDYVLKGTVRRDDQKVRVTAELVNLKDQTVGWADSYDRDATGAVATEADLGTRIARAVSARLVTETASTSSSAPTNNAAAVEAYFKGRYCWHKATEEDLQKSLEFFGKAREIDPGFALAHAGIAEAYITLANNGMKRPRDCFPKAQEAVERALALDQSVADTHVAMAQIKCYWDWNWAGAEREFLHALDLGPGLATAHHAYAHFLSEMGRADEALAEVKRAQELEPLSAAINSDAGWFYFRARRYDEAIAECRKVLDLEPGFQSSEACILMSLIKKGMPAEARSEAQRFLAGHNRTGSMPGIDAADPAEAMRNLDLDSIRMMKQMQQTRYVGSYGFASLYADLGDRDNAFKWLETAFQERERVMVVLNVHPLFDPIRNDPRFADLVRRVRLPSGSAAGG
ncbi:MAG TPA: hypothetical protein VKJ45_25095 [Blastocatellia bacterium]|nr:hypothetical protein [Blastocatellia bacterium]